MESSFVSALFSQPCLPSPLFCYGDATPETVAKKVCACLNDAGGWIVVGVNDDHIYTGVLDEEFDKQVRQEITEHIMPLPLVYVQYEEYCGRSVVLVTVPKGSLAPYTYRGRYYVLKDSVTEVPTPDYLAKLIRESGAYRSDWERVNNLYATGNDLDGNLMTKVYENGLSLGRLKKSEDGLRGLLSDLNLLNTTDVSNGAVALFASDTKKLLPQCRLRIQVMARGKDADSYDDFFFVEGNVFDIQRKTIDYFKNSLPRVGYFFTGRTGRYNDFEYPMEVLDEAVSNALIHRDYTDISDEVTIFVFADRIEISNSGNLPEKLVKGKSKVLPHGSVLRNPLMAEIFYVAGEMEKTGRGMMLISNTMRKAGRKAPEWISSNGRTTLKLYNSKDNLEPNGRIRFFLSSRKKGDFFSKADYMDAFEKKPSKGTVQNDLLRMIELGISVKEGNGPSTRYRLI